MNYPNPNRIEQADGTLESVDYMILPREATIDQLLSILIDGKIPVETYGTGNAKTIHDLLSEINEGEAILKIDANCNVYREVNVLWSDVLCERADGKVYLVREDRQEFKDGRVKRRALDSSIGEKLKSQELPEDAVSRALLEELGVGELMGVYKIGYEEKTFIPDTFPGIESTYKMHKFVTTIPESEFNPDGYVERQNSKTNYYKWDLIYSPKPE